MARVERHRPDAGTVLRALDDDSTVVGYDGLVDPHGGPVPVDVGPPQGAHLSPAGPRGGDHADEGGHAPVVSAGGGEHGPDLAQLGRPHVLGLLRQCPFRQVGVGHRVGEAVTAPLAGQAAGPVEKRSDLMHARFALTFLLELPQVALHVVGAERPNLLAADVVLDMHLPDAAVAPEGARAQVVPPVALPAEDRVVDRRVGAPVEDDVTVACVQLGDKAGKLPLSLALAPVETRALVAYPAGGVPPHVDAQLPHSGALLPLASGHLHPQLVGILLG